MPTRMQVHDIARQVGHEVAHAVARHSSEKLSLGIFVTVASQLAFQVFQVYVRNKQGPAQGRGPGGGAQGIPVAWYILSPILHSPVHPVT